MRAAVVALLVAGALAAAGALLRAAPVPPAAAAPLRVLCGAERWSVKSFADPDRLRVNLRPVPRTVRQLNALVRPAHRPANGRTAAERRVYRVEATITVSIDEADGDVHLVLTGDDGSTLIGESPRATCTAGARDRTAIMRARAVAQSIRTGTRVTATGVGFFDFAHRQTGHARNYIELHPLLSLRSAGPST